MTERLAGRAEYRARAELAAKGVGAVSRSAVDRWGTDARREPEPVYKATVEASLSRGRHAG